MSGGLQRRSQPGARHMFILELVPVVATPLIGETLAWIGEPLYGAAWYAFMYVVLINVVIRLRPSVAGESARPGRFDWRVAVLLSVVVADRLLVLSMPPFQTRDLYIPVLWALPLLIGGILVRRGRQPWLVLPAAPLIVVVTVASLALGTVTAMLVPPGGWRVEIGAPAVVAAIVGAFAVQEWLYRRVVQPVAMRVWGVAAGCIVASVLAGFAWLAALTFIWSINAVTLIAVIVASMMFGYVAAIGQRGVWLAALGCAAFMTALLVYQSGSVDGAHPLNLVGFPN